MRYNKELIEILGTYHALLEVSPIEALNLPPLLVYDLLEWKSDYIKEMNDKLQMVVKEQL